MTVARVPGLAAHLREAIALNRARRAGYVAAGGARAALLSRALVAVERALLPAAHLLDRQAAAFWREGVPVVRADLRPMDGAPPAATPLRPSRGDAVRAVAAARRLLREHRAPVGRHLRRGRLAPAGARLARAAADLRRLERDAGVHLALAEHVVASAALAATHGAAYAVATGGRSAALSVRFVRGHLALLPAALGLDRAAHPLHARGVGLFVNDLPPVYA